MQCLLNVAMTAPLLCFGWSEYLPTDRKQVKYNSGKLVVTKDMFELELHVDS
jgi:hypothetical protein